MAKRKAPKILGGVPRKKAKRDEQALLDKRAVKLSANAIFQKEHAVKLVGHFKELSLKATKISYLASLYFLYRVNKAYDLNFLRFFTHPFQSTAIPFCFRAVTKEYIESKNEPKMEEEFSKMVAESTTQWEDMRKKIKTEILAESQSIEEKKDMNPKRHIASVDKFEWPSRHRMGNAFNYLFQQYESNVTTNLTSHCEERLVHFLKMKCYQFNLIGERHFDHIDIRNAKMSILYNQDWTENDPERKKKMDDLFTEVQTRCLESFNEYPCMTEYIQKKWLESLYFFIGVQREISAFLEEHYQLVQAWLRHKADPVLHDRPTRPLPPKIKNFTVVPLCDMKLKHIKFDHTDLLALIKQWGIVPPKFGGIGGKPYEESKHHFKENPFDAWSILFDMNKINEMKRPDQIFHRMILCDSVSASVLYHRPHRQTETFNLDRIRQKLEMNQYKYIIPLDPGVNTYLAGFRRNVNTCVEENIKISPKQYHWGARRGVRDNEEKILTHEFTDLEQEDRELNYPKIPSPRGEGYESFLRHRSKMMQPGLGIYARRKFARLSLDKYIESTREMDFLAKALTKNQPSLLTIGDADLPSNSKIGKKKTKRCPGTRRLQNSIKKLHHSDVVKVNEAYTSQHCSNCMRKFPKETKSFRFKVCKQCSRNANIPPEIDKYMSLPPVIVTKKSSRRKSFDSLAKWFLKNGIRNAANQYECTPERLASPKMYFLKNWPLNSANAIQLGEDADQQYQPEQQQHLPERKFCIVWHRDIVAARCIMYKALCSIFNLQLMNSFVIPPQPPRPPYRRKPPVRRKPRRSANVVPHQVNQ